MTVVVGKYHINLGWEALAGLMVFTIATSFSVGVWANKFLDRLDNIEAFQKNQAAKDSAMQVVIRMNAEEIGRMKPDVENLKAEIKSQEPRIKRQEGR